MYENNSGGAKGADTQWDIIGHEYGVTIHHHYWYGKMNPKSKPEDKISEEDFLEGCEMVRSANLILKRKSIEKYMNLLARNWLQVKNSEAIYAISTLKSKKEVNGGTGWAVCFGIMHNKMVYVFDQDKLEWYKYSYILDQFIKCEIPILTEKYAGIGTREINEDGIRAIHDVYKKTFNK